MTALRATNTQLSERFVATDFEHWSKAWAALGVHDAPHEAFDALLRSYGEAHRAYHTRRHLEDCLVALDEARSLCDHPDEVALALWFHDAIYKSRRSDNEAASADWLARVASSAGVEESSIARMHALVMATRHTASALERDARTLVDIDLSILGASRDRFDLYEIQVRKEYRWVPGPVYRAKRAQVLQSFLDRPVIYTTSLFYDRLEQVARENISRSLGRDLGEQPSG